MPLPPLPVELDFNKAQVPHLGPPPPDSICKEFVRLCRSHLHRPSDMPQLIRRAYSTTILPTPTLEEAEDLLMAILAIPKWRSLILHKLWLSQQLRPMQWILSWSALLAMDQSLHDHASPAACRCSAAEDLLRTLSVHWRKFADPKPLPASHTSRSQAAKARYSGNVAANAARSSGDLK